MAKPRADSPLLQTPALERALMRLRSRLRLLVVLHGLGTVFAITAAWLVFAFLADWGLHVPAPIRILHSAALVGIPAWFLWRELVRPFLRIPNRAGLAVLLERGDPELHELFISAAEFQRSADANGDPELVRAVCEEAEERARSVRPQAVLDRKSPAMRVVAGLTCVGVTAMLFVASQNHAKIFFHRLLGRDVAWPQRTHLVLEIPNLDEVEITPTLISVRVARGSDVAVVIRARGVAPDDVTLHFADGSRETLPRGNGRTYRRVLRQVQADQEFYVTGGDDRDHEPLVRLSVLQPPDISGIAVRVQAPSYTGLPETLEFNRDVEVLAGSTLTVHVLADPPEARGIARLLPEDRSIELAPRPFPVDPSTATDTLAAAPGLAFELTAERTIRYRFELTDSAGLSNPDPGLYGIRVAQDRPPEVLVLSPGRSDVETVAGGSIPVRVRAKDDFGLTSMRLSSSDVRGGAEPRSSELVLRALPGNESGSPVALEALAGRRIGIEDLAGSEEVAEGALFLVEITAIDNREPEPNEGAASPFRVRIVSSDEFMRRVQDRLARVRQQAAALSSLQTEKRQRVEELLEVMQSDDFLKAGDSRALSGALNGERRVAGDATSLSRELANIVETVLYARVDDKGGALLEALDANMATVADRTFHSEAWTSLIAGYEAGAFGAAGLSGNLLDILAVAIVISETHTHSAVLALERAQGALEITSIRDALEEASGQQALALTRIEDLLERLAEWDSFQSVLALTRDLLERQSALRQRTQRFATEK